MWIKIDICSKKALEDCADTKQIIFEEEDIIHFEENESKLHDHIKYHLLNDNSWNTDAQVVELIAANPQC